MAKNSSSRRAQKRALELHEKEEPTFAARADGAYTNAEMPKRINCGHMVGETYARMCAFDLEEELVNAVLVRLKIEVRAMLREMKAKAAAASAG